jgi:predicted nucleic acid-binding protein
MTATGLSGQQIAATNVQKFAAWVAERDAANDWPDYIRRGQLNRTEIANECCFALSVLRQNPQVKEALEALEIHLRGLGILPKEIISPDVPDAVLAASAKAIDKRIMSAKTKAEARAKALEEQNASLKAEIRDLREQLARFKHLDEHLCRTGRLLHP